MKERVVIPEILDELSPDDPRSIRSRRDLRLINALMGNYGWLAGRIRNIDLREHHAWVELGAGDGRLADSFRQRECEDLGVSGVDFAPRPGKWPTSWPWHSGDVFELLPRVEENSLPRGLVANLFLHHFKTPELERIGRIASNRFSRMLFSEPARYPVFRVLGYALFPFVNEVTRHDMQVSIAAGFRPGELPEALGLGSDWKHRESVSALGAYRFEAWRE